MIRMTDGQLDKELEAIFHWHIGKEKAVERWSLVEKIFGEPVPPYMRNDDNPQDREIRYAVSRLRLRGHLICDLGNGNGRYLAANEAEFWELYHYYVKPIKVRAETLRAMKKAALEKWPGVEQYSLFNLDELESV